MMDNREKLIGALVIALLVGTVGLMVYQETMIHNLTLQLEEQIGIEQGESAGWGATYYVTVIRDGEVIYENSAHNMITNAGRMALRGHIANITLAVWEYVAIGTGSGGGVASTTLEVEAFRALGLYELVGSYNFTLTVIWPEGTFNGEVITEYGVFNDPTTGILLSYQDDFSRTLESTDAFRVVVNYQIGS